MLVDIGYKEIEVSFPASSDTDFVFTRQIVESPAIPDDVWIQVIAPCREDLIRRTIESVRGAKKAIVHLYLATSECFRQVVFKCSKEETLAAATRCAGLVRSLTKDDPSQQMTEWGFEFTPEAFSDTEPEFAIQVCEAVKAVWEPSAENPIIFNLPATVEMSTPNVYADQIEHFCRTITEREKVCVSLHPHNDRGCAVAAAEQAQMAGADRVEGCLLGNGERTGNVDLVTLALNLYTQGVRPNVDFSDMDRVITMVERCTKIPVPMRAPYYGPLSMCAFSGSHQDAIMKGLKLRDTKNMAYHDRWRIPYLPLDPRDIGRKYEAAIRVNSQSGKSGAAWIIQSQLHLTLPRGLTVEFSKVVKRTADGLGRELRSEEVTELFQHAYVLDENPRYRILNYSVTIHQTPSSAPDTVQENNIARVCDCILVYDGKEYEFRCQDTDPISSFMDMLRNDGIRPKIAGYTKHEITVAHNADTKSASCIECTTTGGQSKVWGVGFHKDAVLSLLIAFLSAASKAGQCLGKYH